ncbi:MAG: tRNA (N(6)-L-threonylcarbamoyladenosine(37)-C(2))-methylthiotransferase MtaB [Spirochaetaceae bacterium]|nr:tRNA (N(6)-L-threonylcarbamoyladenosine(37)-C(2))-methylthiotransferase MtaB [Spirochaetaceae bacterium]
MSALTFSIETLGCKLNQYESESIAEAFINAGFNLQNEGKTDIAIINSCAVTGKSEQKGRRAIRARLGNSRLTIAVGCGATVSKAELQALGDNLIVITNEYKNVLLQLPQQLVTDDDIMEAAKNFIDNFKSHQEGNAFAFTLDKATLHTRATLKIQDGCSRSCSYCLTRLARGASQSLPADEVIARLQQLAAGGAYEVVLTGVNLSLYHDDKVGNLWDLLDKIFAETDGFRIRLSSLEPQFILNAPAQILTNPRLCPHFHLSIQSGSDEVLKSMQRPYNSRQIIEAVFYLRRFNSHCFIACDIIVAYPTETKADFAATLKLLKTINVAYIHAFPFSPRLNTEAFKLKPLPPGTAHQRMEVLKRLTTRYLHLYYKESEGLTVAAIIEDDSHDGLRRCRSEYYHDLWVKNIPSNLPAGSLIKAEIIMGDRGAFIAALPQLPTNSGDVSSS